MFGLLLCLVFLTAEDPVHQIKGKVVGVLSGDTFAIDTGAESYYKVRLAEVDCPDFKQPMYAQALNFTRDLIADKQVTVKYDYVDRFNVVIGYVILIDGRMLNRELVRMGWAWYYPTRTPRNEEFETLQYEAWMGRVGLWIADDPQPPWILRRESGFKPPPPPARSVDMDYESVLYYGLYGDPKKRIYQWPDCAHYGTLPPRERVVFSHLSEAENAGFQMSPECREAAKKLHLGDTQEGLPSPAETPAEKSTEKKKPPAKEEKKKP